MNKTKKEIKRGQNNQNKFDRQIAVPLSPEESLKTSDLEMEEEMIGLYFFIDSLFPDLENKVIQFIGSKAGEGTSTIIRALAKVVSEKFGKSVRLVDMDKQKPGQFIFFDIKSENGAQERLPIDTARDQVSEPRSFVKPLLNQITSSQQKTDVTKKDDFWENMREKFDFILVDSPPAATSSIGLAISRKMDGVVLVLEAEKTRWEMAESAKEKITKYGGKVLGVVLNKRKLYIPDIIYKNI